MGQGQPYEQNGHVKATQNFLQRTHINQLLVPRSLEMNKRKNTSQGKNRII
jgi:hypothetical protein